MAIKEDSKRITITLNKKDMERIERLKKILETEQTSKVIHFLLEYIDRPIILTKEQFDKIKNKTTKEILEMQLTTAIKIE